MTRKVGEPVLRRQIFADDRVPLERQTLALDALSKLTRQFCDKPDFKHLIDVLLMTLCGQFSVTDAFAMLRKPSAHGVKSAFFATGRFRREVELSSLRMGEDDWRQFSERRAVMRIAKGMDDGTEAITGVLGRCGVRVVCPLVHGERFFGVVGLGDRVNKRSYEEEDTDLLNAILNTITPLVASSYLFWEIARLNDWYLDILNSVRQGVFVFDGRNRLKNVNSAGLAILRTFVPKVGELGSLHEAPIEAIFPDSIFLGWTDHLRRARALKQDTSINSIIARGDNVERIYNVRVSGGRNSDMGTALVVTLDDVTDQKTSEQRLFDLERFADKGRMASSIAHEINNFLGLLLGGVELAELALENGDQERALTTLARLKDTVGQMDRFTAGLTRSARFEMSRRFANLNGVISDVLSFFSVQKRFKGITISRYLDSRLPDFEMDVDRMAQLVLNLMNNAIDAIGETQEGTGEIVIKTLYDHGDAVLIVSDDGVGIDPEVRKKLFKSHLTTKESGHGYGLMACARIVDDHRGKIAVESRVGLGTTFMMRFPADPGTITPE